MNTGTKYYYGTGLVYKYVKDVFPEVEGQLKKWKDLCSSSGDEMLGRQALASISLKRFHAQGGSIFALYPGVDMQKAVRFITALQTISDYLDNLCDRAGVRDEAAFRQLHLAMLDAVDTKRGFCDYYKFYPFKNDADYLSTLVEECRQQLKDLPSYGLAIDTIKKYVRLYSDLQTYKHLPEEIREEYLRTWADYYLKQYPGISCWEFAAAAGSTLGIFVLFAASFDPALKADEVAALDRVYFPWINGLHILLDYYIDSREDLQTGDLNFTYYYSNLKHCEERLHYFIYQSMEQCKTLKYPGFHTTIVKGLLAMYLSDPKADFGMNKLTTRSLLYKSQSNALNYYKICKLLRMTGIL
jgi:tetraprenyl-beta-curcumene synthase